jgi:penicillin-binding protein 2
VNERLVLLGLVVAIMMTVFAGRFTWLQVVAGERWSAAVDQSRLIREPLPPRRGRILDRTGTAIADARAVYDLAVVFSDLELQGRARRAVPVLRLDAAGCDALVADLSTRVRTPPPGGIRSAVQAALDDSPAVAHRSRRRGQDPGEPALVAISKDSFDPRLGTDDDDSEERSTRLSGSDLLDEDPRVALERELAGRWGIAAQVISVAELNAAAAAFALAMPDLADRSGGVFSAFAAPFTLAVPAPSDPLGSAAPTSGGEAMHLLTAAARNQMVEALAALADEDPGLISDRLDRALAGARRPPQGSTVLYGPASAAERIAALLPRNALMREFAIPGVPGARSREWLLQGDPPDGDGALTRLVRRLAADLDLAPVDLAGVIDRHAEELTPAACERLYGTHQLVLDQERLDRLGYGLAVQLTAHGQALDRLAIDRLLAAARRTADRAWRGQTRSDPIPLLSDVPHALAIRLTGRDAEPPRELRKRFEDTSAELPGLAVVVDVGRSYPFPGSSSHLLGALGRDPDDPAAPAVGRWGLERTYDERLRGLPGSRLRIRTPDGNMLVREEPPTHGQDVVTELDLEVQSTAEDSLENWFALAEALGTATTRMDKARAVGKGRAGFVLLDCHTGGIISLASAPGYRLDELRSRYADLLAAPGNPLIDHAAVPEQPPGSSMKICTALASLEFGAVNPGESIYCQGFMARVNGKPVLRDHAPAGTYDLATAIQLSSNVYFAIIGTRLGAERLTIAAGQFGLGRNNAIDVPHQRPGILPTPGTIAALRPREATWLPSDTWRMAIGQFATASPLQVVTFAAAVANGGYVVRPYLVRPAGGPELTDLRIRRDWLDDVRRGMERVTTNEPHSTARLLVLEGKAAGIKVAAKTGTAEWGSAASRADGRTPDHAWMIGYAPADNPTVAFACYIHSGTFGGQACTPVIKRVLETYFSKYGRDGHTEAVTPPEPAKHAEPADPIPAEEEPGG